tara:strand:- start:626 stop:958 length:333 start_codon:yes stop_codon:yes gene_type:complete
MSKKMKERSMGMNPDNEFFVEPKGKGEVRVGGRSMLLTPDEFDELDTNVLRDVAKSLTAVAKDIPFVVELYYGGEQTDEVRQTFNLQEARAWALSAEHSLIMWDGKEVEQ